MDRLNQKIQKGFSTIELMIALALLILILTGVVAVAFTNQAFLTGSLTNAEAMKIAQGLIEEKQALGRKDFNLVNPTGPTTEDIYTKSVSVKLLSDFLTKEVKALVTWKDEHQNDRKLELTTLVSNFETPVGGNTCDSTINGNWHTPQVDSTINFDDINPDGVYTITDVDAYKNKLYVTAGKTSNSTHPTLFIFDISDPHNPDLEGQTDYATAVTAGLSAVRVAEDPATLKLYAYAASNTDSDYSTCDPLTNPACGQLDIFDVTHADSPTFKTNLKIASTTPISGSTKGASIFYKNRYLLLGLTATSGPEFFIIDVYDPPHLFGGTHLVPTVGEFEVGNTVNALYFKNKYAYLATPNTQELKILDLDNPGDPEEGTPKYGFNSATGAGNGKSIFLVGDKLYLGKTTGAGKDFHILDNEDPTSVLNELGGVDVGSSINGVLARDYLSFLVTGTPSTGTKLEIFKTDDPSNIVDWGELTLAGTSHATEPSIDCEGNRLFISSNDASGQGSIYIVKPGN